MRQFVLLIFLALFISGAPPGDAAEVPSEYQVKAAYLYNFAKFIHWPDTAFVDPGAPLVIGVLGENPFGDALSPLTGKTVRARKIEVRQFNSLAEMVDCHMLYVSIKNPNQLRMALTALESKPVITVSSEETFCELGGVQFVTKRDRLRFVINLDVAKANNIRINAQLLAMAAEVLESDQ